MAPNSSTLAWEIPWTEEPGGLQFMHPGNKPRLLLQQLAQPGGLLREGVSIDASQSLPEAQRLHLGVLGGCTNRGKGRHRNQG